MNLGHAEIRPTSNFLSFNGNFEHIPYVVIPDQNLLVAQFQSGKINELVVSRLDSGAVQNKFNLGSSNWNQLQVSSDGSKLVLIGRKNGNSPKQGTVYSLNPGDLRIKKEFEIDLPQDKNFHRVSPNFRWIVSNNYSKGELVVSALSPKNLIPAFITKHLVKTPPGISTVVPDADIAFKTLAFSPDGERLVVPNKEHSRLLWVDLNRPQHPQELATHLSRPDTKFGAIELSPNGRIVTLSQDKSSNRAFLTLMGSNGELERQVSIPLGNDPFAGDSSGRLRISPDGQTIVLMLNRGLYFYSIKDRRMLKTPLGERLQIVHQKNASGITAIYPPLDVTFLPNGRKALVHIDGGMFEVMNTSP